MGVAQVNTDTIGITKKIDHLHHAAGLERLATAVVFKMKVDRGEKIKQMQEQGVVVVDHNYGTAVECLSERFKIERHYVWLNSSNTLGLELRAVKSGSGEVVGAITLRPDEKALVRGDREFSHSVSDPEGIDTLCAAFLRKIGDNVIVGLPVIAF
jgi:hypothetical protein